MRKILLFAVVLAIVIPALLGNLWFLAVIGYLAETTAEPLSDMIRNLIAPD